MVRQDVASAPVWDAAKAPTSWRPTTRATTGLRAISARTALTSRGPSATDSTCSATAVVCGSSAQVVEHVGRGDVDAVAEPDRQADAVPRLGEQERQRVVDPAAGRDDSDAAGGHRGGRGTKLAVSPAAGAKKPLVLGPSRRIPVVRDDRGQLALKRDALRARLGEAAAADDRGPHPRLRRLGQEFRAQAEPARRSSPGRPGRPPRLSRHAAVHGRVAAVDKRQVPAAVVEAAQRPGHERRRACRGCGTRR